MTTFTERVWTVLITALIALGMFLVLLFVVGLVVIDWLLNAVAWAVIIGSMVGLIVLYVGALIVSLSDEKPEV